MSRICYMVTATLPDARTADEYVRWLSSGHVRQVIEGGAETGIIARLDGEGSNAPRVLTHYTFGSRAAYEHYITRLAPMLRAEGLAKFPPERGVTFERRVGEIVE